ncbi:MAG: hypothetical protein V1664_04900 [Candidatus Uhrbacteria bacterium]
MRNLLQNQAKQLRLLGFTYSEISQKLKGVPKGTLSSWLKNVKISNRAKKRIKKVQTKKLQHTRKLAALANQKKYRNFQTELTLKNTKLINNLWNKKLSKIFLALIFMCEGSKAGGCITFGNSDPGIIKLFLRFLRECYELDEKKFRCTLQAREDQNIKLLEAFWSKVTGIPKNLFYKARIDSRTIGKKSKKKDYKGVCRINYFSAFVYHDLQNLISLIKGR